MSDFLGVFAWGIEHRAMGGGGGGGSVAQDGKRFGGAVGFHAGGLQSAGKFLNAGVTAIGIFGERFHNNGFDGGRDGWEDLAQTWREDIEMLIAEFVDVADEGQGSGEAGIDDDG